MEEKELIKLIDRYLDESLSVEETEEMNDLLENSEEFRSLLRQRVRLHADLVAHYDSTGMDPITSFTQESKKTSLVLFSFVAVAIVLFALFLRSPESKGAQSPAIAQLTLNDATELKSGQKTVSKDTLVKGSYSFSKGMVELEFPHDVTIALEGPAEFTLIDDRKMSLTKGRLSAHVGQAGKGFSVETPGGNIIDLGTRFGVSVSDGGKTEAHVFQGKINVVADSKITELAKNEALELEIGKTTKRISADLSSFPLPGFPLELGLENASFEESAELYVGWPKVAGLWGGDHCELIDYAKEIKTYDGSRMLSFIKPYVKGGKDEGQATSQLWQLVDLRAYEEEVKRGGVSARLSARFNTLESVTNSSFSISMYAFTGKLKEIKHYWDNKKDPLSELLGQSNVQLRTDGNASTWEKIEGQLNIPSGTTFLLVQLSAKDAGTGLIGHYVDGARLEVSTEARMSVPMAEWKGNGGLWRDSKNWQGDKLPDLNRETIRLSGKEEVIVDSEISLKQSLIMALNNDSEAHLRITKKGTLNQTANGQLVVGYNVGGNASVIVEGTLRTRKRAFIGRNNSKSTLLIDGGLWDGKGTDIRMSQYGGKDEATKSLLEIKNNGKLIAKFLQLIHDDAVVELVDGSIEVERLTIGGDNGEAIVNHHSGMLKVDKLTFGTAKGIYYFAGREAQLCLKGEWSVEKLFQIKNSNWHFQGKDLNSNQLNVEMKKYGETSYSIFSLK